MNSRNLLLFICIGCILFAASVSGLKVGVKPLGDVFDDAVNFFEFTFTEVGQLPSQTIEFELHSDSYIKFNNLGNTNYRFNNNCFIKGDENALIATIDSTSSSLRLTFPERFIGTDHTIICPVSISNLTLGSPENNVFVEVEYKDENGDSVEIEVVSLNLPTQPAHPVVTFHSAEIQTVRSYYSVSLPNDYITQELVFSFSTNVIADLRLEVDHFVLHDQEYIPVGSVYCTTGSGKNTKVVGRIITQNGIRQIFLREKTNDLITCQIPVVQVAVLRIPQFPRIRLSFGYNSAISAAIAVENINVNNFGVMNAHMNCFDKNCGPEIEFEIALGNESSYLTESSEIRIELGNVDIAYLRYNSTEHASFEEMGNLISYCRDDNRIITHYTSYVKGSSIYFTDFEFDDKQIVHQLYCILHFNAVSTLNVNQEYGTARVTVNGNAVYNEATSSTFRFDFSPAISIDIVETKRIDVNNGDAEKDDLVSFKFRAYQADRWAYAVNNPVLTISYHYSLPIAYNSIKCSSTSPLSSEVAPIQLTQYYNGVSYNIPVDNDTRLFDVIFHCELAIGHKYNLDYQELLLRVDDVYDNTVSRAGVEKSVPIPKNDYTPPTTTMSSHSCTLLSFFASSPTMTLSAAFANELTGEYIKAYNSAVSGSSLSRNDVFYAPATRNQVIAGSLYAPFNATQYGYSSYQSTLDSILICRKNTDTLDDSHHYKIYTTLKPKYKDIVYHRFIPGTPVWTAEEGFTEEKCQWTPNTSIQLISPRCLDGAKCRVHGDCYRTYCSANGVCEYDGQALPYFSPSESYYTSPSAFNTAMTVTATTTLMMVMGSMIMALFMF